MKKQEKKNCQNYLEYVPKRNHGLEWKTDANGMVTLLVENKGIFHVIGQKLFHRPAVTQVHLDRQGSFVWPLIDGNTNMIQLGMVVKEHFGDEAEPLYERLAQFFKVLESYHFITLNES